MLALVLALASADPSVTASASPHDVDDGHWRAVAFAEPTTGALGIEAPLGPVFVGLGGFGSISRSSSVVDSEPFGGVLPPEKSGWGQAGVVAWLQGRFLELSVVDVSWALRVRGGWASATVEGEGIDDFASTSVSAAVAAGLVADARIVDGVRLRVGVDLVDVGLRSSWYGLTALDEPLSLATDDVELGLFAPQAGIVVDLF